VAKHHLVFLDSILSRILVTIQGQPISSFYKELLITSKTHLLLKVKDLVWKVLPQ